MTAPDPTHPPAEPDVWRVGRKVGRTVYRQLGAAPSDDDPLIGVMDTPELAQRAVDADELSRQIGNLIAELDRQARLHEQAVQDWAGCRERLAEVEAELEQADHFGRGEFRVTTWAYEQVCAALAAEVRRALGATK